MIWFFLMGMVAGAVGMVMLATWWMKKPAKRVTINELKSDLEQMEENNKHD